MTDRRTRVNDRKLFSQGDDQALGQVTSVDTATVIVHVTDTGRLRRMQVNRLVYLQSSKPGERLIGIVQKIVRQAKAANSLGVSDSDAQDPFVEESDEDNTVRVALIGTHKSGHGSTPDVFSRTLETVPEIDAYCFAIDGDDLSGFMQVIANVTSDDKRLDLGTYTLDASATAFLNGDKFFQRHALIVGSTGAGKSWTVARVVEQVAQLPGANAIILDIHGEYSTLRGDSIEQYRVAGPNDLASQDTLPENVLFLPYWLLDHEAMGAIFVDRSDQNAPNQRSLMSSTILGAKSGYLETQPNDQVEQDITIDSPIPFDIDDVVNELQRLDGEMVPGSGSREKQGPHHGRLTRLIERLKNKREDRRLGFMFEGGQVTFDYGGASRLRVG